MSVGHWAFREEKRKARWYKVSAFKDGFATGSWIQVNRLGDYTYHKRRKRSVLEVLEL
jgi:hypothetical protein